MKRILLILIFFTSWFGFGQSITVNSTTYTVPQLVNDVLFGAGAGGGSCAGTISNITWRTGNTNGFGSVNGIGYFQNTNPNFPLSAGVVMTSGDLNEADGPNINTSSGGSGAWTGDAQLFSYVQGLGFDPGLTSYRNASVIEFDFVPLSPSFSFDFMFASEEYGTFQCQYSDAFAFFLTNVTAGTPATNIALIPSTTTPISVLTVRNNLHNPGCSSVNPAFFDKFYQLPSGLNPADSPTNFNGQTVLLTAAATVIPNNTYHIKLVVADRNDEALDSAVFLGAGSFDIGQASISGTVQGGADFSDIIDFSIANSNAICQGDTRTVKAGTAAITGANYQWSVGGVPIPGATSFQYTITAPGTYQVSITYSSGCVITDSILAEYLPAVPLALPNNLTNCSNPSFNLAQNTPVILNGLNPSNYDINYFTTLTNAEDFTAPIANLSSFPGTNGQTIYIRVDDSSGSGCFEILTFTLTITPPPTPPNPSDVTSCNSYTLPALAANETYHTASGGSPSTQIAAGTVITTSQTIYIYVQSAPGCTAEGDFVVTIITGTPPNPSDVTVCGSYTLPSLPAGSTYHSASGGSTATLLPVGTVLTTSQIVYVVSQSSGTPSCSAEGDFALTVNTAPVTPDPADVTACDSYVLPVLPAGQSYHSAAGGSPATQIPAGTIITTNQTIYIFAQSGTVPNCTAEGDFTVTINVTPATPNPADVTVCNSYVLPALPAGSSYHTLPNGGGTTLLAGATITTTQVIYVFAQTGTTPNCTSEGDFLVTVNNTPVPDNPADVTSCGSYTLPALTVGNYFTGTNGSGTPLFAGDVISTNQTIYIYAQTGTVPNCTAENSFDVTIIVAPTINTPSNYVVCDDSYNNDGVFNDFDLLIKNTEITTDPSLTITYHETAPAAIAGGASYGNNYQNITPGIQTIYVAVYNPAAPDCKSFTQFNLVVNPLPLANPVITDYQLCDVTTPGDGVEIFTLNTKSAEIANGQTGVTINYYNNLADATANNTAVALPNLYQNTTANQQQIWINISNNTTGCSSVGTFNLVVNPLPAVTAPDPMFECSNGATNTADFDLTLNNGIISGGNPGVTVTYYLTLADAQGEVSPLALPYTNISNPQTVYVRVENNTTGCFDTTSLQLNVTQGPVANTPTPLEYCDPNNDGYGFFNLTDAIADIVGGTTPTGVSVSFHETATDAQIGATPITDITAYPNIEPGTQTIFVRVFYTLTNCANFVELQLIVNPTPEATEPQPYHECDNDDDGFTIFDLSTINAEVLGSIDSTTHTVLYYTTLAAAQIGDPANAISNVTNYNSDDQTIYVRVTTTATGCFDIVALQLVVDPLPTSMQPAYAPYSLCETTAFGVGFESFNLLSQVPTILNNQPGVAVTFYPSLSEAQSGTNVIPTSSYVNTAIYVQTLGIRLTNEATGCFVVSTMDIRVEPLPTPITPITPPTLCDADQDGYTDFDLNLYTPEILQGANYIITYHETQADAITGNTEITDNPYTNIDPFVQVIWVAAVDPNTGCRQTMPLTLNVNPSPLMPSLNNLTLCDQTGNTQNGITVFDLTVQTPIVLAAQTTPASNYTVTYYTTLANAQGQTNNIVNTTTYTNTSNGQTIWVVVKHNTTDCFKIGTFQLNVNTPLLLTTPTPLSVCDSDAIPNNQFTTFNLTIRDTMITGGLPGYTVTYYPSWPITSSSVAIANPTNYTNTSSAVQTLGVLVTSPQGCTSSTTLDIRVLPIPEPNTNPTALAPQCDYNNPGDMVEIFDLTTNAAYIMNGDPSLTLSYHYTQAEAALGTNPIPNPSAASVGGNVWIRVQNNRVDYAGNNCYVLVEQALTVNPLPSLATIPDYQICEEDAVTNDGFEVFDLTSQAAALLANNPATPVTTYTLTYHTATPPTGANQIGNPTAYTNTINPQTIYVVATNDTTGCRSQVGSFNILVNPKPDIAQPTTLLNTCDSDGTNDGYFAYPLNGAVTTEVLNGQDPTQFAVTFYDSEYNPDATPPLLPTPIANQAGYLGYTHTIWAVVTNIATGCQKITSFAAVVEQLPEPVITTVDNINTICVDFTDEVVVRTLTLTAVNNTVYLDPTTIPAFEYHWFEDGAEVAVTTTPSYTINQPLNDDVSSNFTVQMINQTALMCEQTSANFAVIQSGQAEVLDGTIGYTVTNAFAENQIITVTVQGFGTYEYSLDDGPRQVSNIFENVSLGTHTITVWDTEGGLDNSCDELIITNVQTIDYPHYFTPNGDGIHENWNIVGLSGQPSSKIYIFDRFGKLIKQISSTSEGWDGTFNGQPLPATDYWFTVDFMEQGTSRQFKAHFALKR